MKSGTLKVLLAEEMTRSGLVQRVSGVVDADRFAFSSASSTCRRRAEHEARVSQGSK